MLSCNVALQGFHGRAKRDAEIKFVTGSAKELKMIFVKFQGCEIISIVIIAKF